MNFIGLKTDVLKSKFDLLQTLTEAIYKRKEKIKEGDVLVISSKIVALSEGQIVNLSEIKPGRTAKKIRATRYGHGKEDPRIVELIIRESDVFIPGKMLLSIKNGVLIPEAGIDMSNAPKGHVVLWPKNPQKSATSIRLSLLQKFKIKKLGIVICDSHCQPLRWGVTGLAIAWAGFLGIEDARGQKDIFGKKLQVTKKAVADDLASGASLIMGEAGEKTPFVLVHDAPVKFTNRTQRKNEIFVKPDDCIFGGIYNKELISHFRDTTLDT